MGVLGLVGARNGLGASALKLKRSLDVLVPKAKTLEPNVALPQALPRL